MKGTIRQRLTFAVVGATALMLALLVLGFNISLRSSLDGDVDRLLEARAQATLDNIDLEGGRLNVREGADDGAEDALVWVFAGNRTLESPQIAGHLDQIARSLADQGGGETDDPDSDIRLLARPVIQDGRKVGTVVTGISLEPYERTADRATVASIILAIVMLILMTITTRLVVDRALKPVSQMTEEAADWSEHDLDRRFNEGEPNDELTALAATFDTMLDRMAFMVRHERNFSAEISHELRTPLAAIAAEAELALSKDRDPDAYRESIQRISDRAKDLTRILETLLDVARAEGSQEVGESADLAQSLETAIAPVGAVADRYGVTVNRAPELEGVRIQMAPQTFQRMIAPILENAITYASTSVTISADKSNPRTVEIVVTDDGPGFSNTDLAAAFEPGHSGSAIRNELAPAGTGLGLALSRRLARANGGDVAVAEAAVGAEVRLELPLA